MAIDRFPGRKVPNEFDSTTSPDTIVDPGPYIGTVKAVADSARSGRLRVWIPEFGGEEKNPDNWTTVKYASPFAGRTRTPGSDDPVAKKNNPDKFFYTESTYGFWFVPPDIGNKVICTFIGGRPDDGYWFACVLDSIQHYMIPNIPGSGNSDSIGDPGSSFIRSGVNIAGIDANLPVGEVNRHNPTNITDPFRPSIKRPVHPYQAAIYIAQGLDRDRIRGPSQASSQRESPSSVFGVSTPGRPADDLADDINFRTTGNPTGGFTEVYSRKGGHVFLMDDGNTVGQGQQIRLRSAGGHTILMDDETGVLYINQAQGNAWVELAPTGQIHIYGRAGLNIRSGGDINMHSDGQIKMFAKGEIKMKAEKSVRMEGEKFGISALELKLSGSSKAELLSKQGPVNVQAESYVHMKSGGDVKIFKKGVMSVDRGQSLPLPLKPPKGLTTYSHADTINRGGSWIPRNNEIRRSICNIVPTHEPWDRKSGLREEVGALDDPLEPVVNINESDPGPVERSNLLESVYSGSGEGTGVGTGDSGAIAQVLERDPSGKWRISDSVIERARSQFTAVDRSFGNMTNDDFRVYLASLYVKESGGNYKNTNNPAYMGGFQIGQAVLITYGYVSPEALKFGSRAAFDPSNGSRFWTGKDGLSSLGDFLNNPGLQVEITAKLAASNYQTGVRQGVLDNNSSADQIAGFLAASHLLGGQGAVNYIKFGSASPTRIYDANGTSFNDYYNMMRDAVVRSRTIYGAPAPRASSLQ